MAMGILFSFTTTAHALTVKTPEQIEYYIEYVASHEGVDPGLALAIANAESGKMDKDLGRRLPDPLARNPQSSASGVFQFIDSTFRDYCIRKYQLTLSFEDKNLPALQVNCAIEMLKEPMGYMHWWASSDRWKRLLTI